MKRFVEGERRNITGDRLQNRHRWQPRPIAATDRPWQAPRWAKRPGRLSTGDANDGEGYQQNNARKRGQGWRGRLLGTKSGWPGIKSVGSTLVFARNGTGGANTATGMRARHGSTLTAKLGHSKIQGPPLRGEPTQRPRVRAFNAGATDQVSLHPHGPSQDRLPRFVTPREQ